MQCVVLAGGLGTRMSRFTRDLPKALIPVCGEPFLRHKLRQLAGHGISEVLVSVGHLGDQIVAEVASHAPATMSVRCVPDGPRLLGTGGALRRIADMGLLDDVFMLTYGDSYLTCDHAAVAASFDDELFAALMTVWSVAGTDEVGNCDVTGDRVTSYRKDPDAGPLGWVDYGLSILTRNAVEAAVAPGDVADLSTVFGGLAAAGRLQAVIVPDRYFEIGSEEGLAELEAHLRGSS